MQQVEQLQQVNASSALETHMQQLQLQHAAVLQQLEQQQQSGSACVSLLGEMQSKHTSLQEQLLALQQVASIHLPSCESPAQEMQVQDAEDGRQQ